MAYRFRGFFTTCRDVAEQAQRQWSFIQMKSIENQMQGYVLRSPSEDDLPSNALAEDHDQLVLRWSEIEEALPAFSAAYPDTTLVYIDVDCAGGVCSYEGYHARAGQITSAFDAFSTAPERLKAILAPLGVKFEADSIYFEVFERDYFDR